MSDFTHWRVMVVVMFYAGWAAAEYAFEYRKTQSNRHKSD
ncbi:MAG: hypothetical protein ACI87E_002099 [Mariniblastus sp.]|jgi:hypothetical protein